MLYEVADSFGLNQVFFASSFLYIQEHLVLKKVETVSCRMRLVHPSGDTDPFKILFSFNLNFEFPALFQPGLEVSSKLARCRHCLPKREAKQILYVYMMWSIRMKMNNFRVGSRDGGEK